MVLILYLVLDIAVVLTIQVTLVPSFSCKRVLVHAIGALRHYSTHGANSE